MYPDTNISLYPDSESARLVSAIQDFRQARNQADLQELLNRLTGESNQLLSYDEVRHTLGVQSSAERGIQDIPLNAIIGSVGRYSDFTRDFLPRKEINPERWARVKMAASGLIGLPPIEVYQIGSAYFVKDGNHRVSVARRLGATFIQAYVTEVHSRVPLTPDVQPDDIILIAEYNNFLEKTRLDELRPQADLRATIPGQYQVLLEHINVHHYYMGLDLQREVLYQEAVTHWYDAVYLPVVNIIREQAVLHRFPGRTETDLYLWIAEHRAHIEEQLGWKIKTEYAATDLAEQFSPTWQNWFSRVGEKLLDWIIPDKLEAGPPTGQWRNVTEASRPTNCLFFDILVPVNGQQDGWCALEQALIVARQEGSHLHGLHIVKEEREKDTPGALTVKKQFEKRCRKAGIDGQLVIAANSDVAREIYQRAGWADLVVTNLTYPPSPQPMARLASGFRDLILHCPRPILATPQTTAPLEHALLAYDGSPKAKEALYMAAYLAGKWRIPIQVISVIDGRVTEQTLQEALEYLQSHGVQADAQAEKGPVAESILKAAEAQYCDLIIMGGYGLNPVLEVVLGSDVDRVLNESHRPMMICR